MGVNLAITDVVDFLGGSHSGSTTTLYGLTISDTTMTARVIMPVSAYVNNLLGDTAIANKQALSDSYALHRAARITLLHVRQLFVAGGKTDSYVVGTVSINKPALLQTIMDATRDLERSEREILALLLGAGEANGPADLLVQNPIANTSGASEIDLDAQGYGPTV